MQCKSVPGTLFSSLLLVLAIHPLLSHAFAGGTKSVPVDGLKLSLTLLASGRETPEQPEFGVGFENVGDHDIALILGRMLANGRFQIPYGVSLRLTDGEGKTRELVYMDRQHAGVAGRMDDYVVPLRVGSTYTLRLGLRDFCCLETKEFDLRLAPGKYRVVARFKGGGTVLPNRDMAGLQFLPFWKGTVQSNLVALDRR
jgi:hypothetical protein